MTETVSFPGLGLSFVFNRVAFNLFGIPVYWYGIILTTGLLFGIIYAFSNSKRVGVDPDRLVDVLMAGVVGALVGARTYYVIFSWDMFKDDLMRIFNIRHGGIAIYGAIIGGILAGAVVCKIRRVRILPTLDLAAGGFLIGQAVGRWGNFVNIEAFGDNTTSIFGMTSPAITGYLEQVKRSGAAWAAGIDPNMPVHPTFFYESVWCLLGFLVMAFLVMPKRRFDGECFLFYAIWYGAGRFVIEGLRTDSLMWGGIRVSQILGLLCVLVCLGIWAKVRLDMRKKGEGYLPLFVTTEEGQQVVNGTFYQKAEPPEIVVEEPGIQVGEQLSQPTRSDPGTGPSERTPSESPQEDSPSGSEDRSSQQ